jgi:DNA (cytosine-5)-methyltransferase 1
LQASTILRAGFPCQPFSQLGCQRGFNDPRSNVLEHLLQAASINNTPAILLENVPSILTQDAGNTIKHITNLFNKYNYHFHIRTTETSNFLPRRRNRTFFHLYRPDLATNI